MMAVPPEVTRFGDRLIKNGADGWESTVANRW